MNIEFTNRNIKKLTELNNNIRDFSEIAFLENQIDGAVIQSNSEYINLTESRNIFKDYFVTNNGVSSEAFDYVIPTIEPVFSTDFMQNPYLKNISLPHITMENLRLEEAYYQKHEFVMLNEPTQFQDLRHHLHIGVFDGPARTYVLKNNDFVWMSICPMEINTMAKSINEASGSVLVLGGGLAYYSYMVSIKESVTDVTIIEKDPKIYEVIKEYILPQFPNKKCSILLDDATDFIERTDLSCYNTVFFDIWEDNLTGADYYKDYVKCELQYPDTKFQYWLEDSILDTFVVNISEYFNAKLGTEESQRLFKVLAPDLWDYMESINDTIKRPEQIDYYLTKKIAKQYLLGLKPT